jgi:hypothetical protein
VVAAGVKLAYAAPLVATSLKLTQLTGLADGVCDCSAIPGGTFDATPYGGDGPSCCTCQHCLAPRPDQTNGFGSVLYPGAFYNITSHLCASTRFPAGFSANYCAPICTPCLTPASL